MSNINRKGDCVAAPDRSALCPSQRHAIKRQRTPESRGSRRKHGIPGWLFFHASAQWFPTNNTPLESRPKGACPEWEASCLDGCSWWRSSNNNAVPCFVVALCDIQRQKINLRLTNLTNEPIDSIERYFTVIFEREIEDFLFSWT